MIWLFRVLFAFGGQLVFLYLVYNGLETLAHAAYSYGAPGVIAFASLIFISHFIFFYLAKIMSTILCAGLYDITVENRSELMTLIRSRKPFILCPSHHTYVDWAFIFHVMPWWPICPIRFAVWYTYFFAVLPFMWLAGAFPMASVKVVDNNGKKEKIEPLMLKFSNWTIMRLLCRIFTMQMICVFPEGKLSRSDVYLSEVKKGVSRWVKMAANKNFNVAVLKLGISIEKSVFGRKSYNFLLPKKVKLIFGKPIYHPVTPRDLAEGIATLSNLKVCPKQK